MIEKAHIYGKLGTDRLLSFDKARAFIQTEGGVRLSQRATSFGPGVNLAAGDYALISPTHCLFGRVLQNGEKIIMDFQTQTRISWSEAIELYGNVGAYRVIP